MMSTDSITISATDSVITTGLSGAELSFPFVFDYILLRPFVDRQKNVF